MWEDFKRFVNRPFSSDMDALGWFLFFGLLIAISIAWGFILKHISENFK